MANKNTNKEVFRLPRPMGITQLMIEYHSTHNQKLFDNVTTFLIQQWIISNGKICGKDFSLLGLSKFLSCKPERIRKHMMEMLVSTNIWDKDNQEKIMNSLIGQNLTWLLEDRMEVENQLSILKLSQGGKYTPFITSEVNKTLGLKLNTSANLQSFIRSLSGGNNYINIFNQNNQVNQQNNQFISYDDALKIVQEDSDRFLSSDKELKYIESNYDIDELPEVVATKQLGVDTTKEGLNLSSHDISSTIDTYYKDLDEPVTHENRREKELGVDDESEDPELNIYPG